MAKTVDYNFFTSTTINSIPFLAQESKLNNKLLFKSNTIKASSSSKINHSSLRSKAPRRRLITISTSADRWQGNWTCEFVLSLRELRLDDLVEDEQKDVQVSITLCMEKHAGFGLSVEGKIVASFTRKCSCCYTPYCREIDTNFNVWVLPSRRDSYGRAIQNRGEENESGQLPSLKIVRDTPLPEIGGDDPSVIYVKPGDEANLDSLIQDTIRLTISVKDTCSETCENSEPTLQYIGGQNAGGIDGRWSRLLELKKRLRSSPLSS